MSKIGNPSGPRLPGEAPPTEDKRTGEGSGQGAPAAPAPGAGQPTKRVLSAGDVERLASQSGFVRTGGNKKGRRFDVGDHSQAPIPLPEDDLDLDLTAASAFEGLEQAESQLLSHSARLSRSRQNSKQKSLQGFLQAIVAGDTGSEEDGADAEAAFEARSAALQALPAEPLPDAKAMAAMARSVAEHFALDLSGVPVGPQLMAASLLVAGQRDDVAMAPGPAANSELDAERLLGGAGRVIDAGRQAADDARSRADGMNRNIALQRTFVPKR